MNGIEQNRKLGYYKVGEKIFFSKPEAYIYATNTGIDPVWNFNLSELVKFDWEVEPELGIRELYKLRAQQLRDRYDWIRIEASGGSDSTTAIFSFLLNGIHLDEVIFRYPAAFEKDVSGDPHNTSPENTLSEWEFAAKPLFNWIKTNYPAVKTTFHDYSENLLEDNYMKDESWVFSTRDWFQPGHGIKHTNFGTIEQRRLADSGKSIGVVYGVDKPKIQLIDGHWYLFFFDTFPNHPNPVIGDHTNITSELFYWTPDLPELVCKQAHMVKNWFNMPQNHQFIHLVQPKSSQSHNDASRTAYEHISKGIIYPDYDLATWQTGKPSNSFFNEMDHWFHVNAKDTQLYSAWESGLQMLIDKIDKKYFKYEHNKPVGLVTNSTPFLYLGPAEIKNNKIQLVTNKSGYRQIIRIKNKKLEKISID